MDVDELRKNKKDEDERERERCKEGRNRVGCVIIIRIHLNKTGLRTGGKNLFQRMRREREKGEREGMESTNDAWDPHTFSFCVSFFPTTHHVLLQFFLSFILLVLSQILLLLSFFF